MQLNTIIISVDEYEEMRAEIARLTAANKNLHSYIDDLKHNLTYSKKQLTQLTTSYGDDDEIIARPVVHSAINR